MSIAIDQVNNILPARGGAVWVQTLDTTSRPYDISALALDGSTRGWIIITIEAETCDVYYALGPSTLTVDQTAANAAGAAVSYVANGCARIPAGQSKDVRIERSQHKFIALKGSAAGIARIYASSERSGGT